MTCVPHCRVCCLLPGVLALCGLLTIGAGFTEPPADSKPAAAAKPAPKGDPYPLDHCIVSGEKLGSMGTPVVKMYEGREVRFCCNGCVKEFEADKAKFMKKIDAEIVEQQIKHYPLTHCVVMEDDELGSEGTTPVDYVYNNRLVRFCCRECIKPFNADPAKFLAKIDTAVIKQQKEQYPLDSCPISGKKLESGSVDHVYGVTLVRFCCPACIEKFNEDPQPVIAKLHAAWMAKHGGDHDKAHDKDTDRDAHAHDHDGHDHDH